MSSQKRDNIEVRLNNDGTVDEIVVCDPHTKQCLFHIEQMDEHYYWMRAYGTTQDLVAHIGAIIGPRRGKPIVGDDGKPIAGEPLAYETFEGPKVDSNFEWEDSTMESQCDEKYATPEVERRREIAEIINKYGIACALQQMTDIYNEGRQASHDLALIAGLNECRKKFLSDDKDYWDALLKNNLQTWR